MKPRTSSRGGTDRLRVAAVQMKFAPTMDGNLDGIGQHLAEAAKRRADAVLFPECATTGYGYDFSRLTPCEVREALVRVGELAERFQVNVLIGSPVFRRGRLHNCLVVFDRSGAATYCYAKCHLTESDRRHFTPGNAVALFDLDGICATTVICHERRYPELVRLAAMGGARVLFHPNAGMDALAVSRRKRGGKDGIPVRAFENAIYYVFANSVGAQAEGKWSAGDSKIVAPDETVLAIADNRSDGVIVADLDLALATRSYATRGLTCPRFLATHWRNMVDAVRKQAADLARAYDLPRAGGGRPRCGPRPSGRRGASSGQ
ncbi:MAG: carbon-nitrogen hydrolase family protein [Pirellulales bacterium]|nr:carbon-nitrogen hydrolase family protein [Pirellulales bacterium]